MAKLDRHFIIASLAGITVMFVISYIGTTANLPTPIFGFVLGVWTYLSVHDRKGMLDWKESAAYSVFFTVAYFAFVFVAGLGLVLAGLLPYDVVVNSFPININVCIMFDVVLTLLLGAFAGAAFRLLRSAILLRRLNPPSS